MYSIKIKKDGKVYNKGSKCSKDTVEAVAGIIVYAVLVINCGLREKRSEAAILERVTLNLGQDVIKYPTLMKAYGPLVNKIQLYCNETLKQQFAELKKFGTEFGLNVEIAGIIMPSLQAMASKVVVKNKHKFFDDIKTLPDELFVKFPGLMNDANRYVKLALEQFCTNYQPLIKESQVIFDLIIACENSKNIYKDVHTLLTEHQYKTFTKHMKKHLNTPIFALMKKKNKGDVDKKAFDEGMNEIVNYYQPDHAEAKMLIGLKNVLRKGSPHIINLHGLLNDKTIKLSQQLKVRLRTPLVDIVKGYNAIQIEKNKVKGKRWV